MEQNQNKSALIQAINNYHRAKRNVIPNREEKVLQRMAQIAEFDVLDTPEQSAIYFRPNKSYLPGKELNMQNDIILNAIQSGLETLFLNSDDEVKLNLNHKEILNKTNPIYIQTGQGPIGRYMAREINKTIEEIDSKTNNLTGLVALGIENHNQNDLKLLSALSEKTSGIIQIGSHGAKNFFIDGKLALTQHDIEKQQQVYGAQLDKQFYEMLIEIPDSHFEINF